MNFLHLKFEENPQHCMHNAYRISNHNHNEIDKSTSTFVFIQKFSFAFSDYYYLSFIIQYETKQWYTYFAFRLPTSNIESLCHLIFIQRFFALAFCSMNQFFYLVHVSCESNNKIAKNIWHIHPEFTVAIFIRAQCFINFPIACLLILFSFGCSLFLIPLFNVCAESMSIRWHNSMALWAFIWWNRQHFINDTYANEYNDYGKKNTQKDSYNYNREVKTLKLLFENYRTWSLDNLRVSFAFG